MDKKDELENTVDELEQEVIAELDLNPTRCFDVIFPYTCCVKLPGEDTTITIKTISQHVVYAYDQKMVVNFKEYSDEHEKLGLAKYITEYVRENLWNIKPEDYLIEFTGEPTIREMSVTEIRDYSRELFSGNAGDS